MRRARLIATVFFLALAVYGLWQGTERGPEPDSRPAGDALNTDKANTPVLKPLVFYTALTTTTPQLPLLSIAREGFFERHGYRLELRYWKNLDDLRGVILAGRGDLWLGHLETLAQSRERGAPVTLLAVTGWRKFYFVSADPGVKNFAELEAALKQKHVPLAVTPPDGPAPALMRKLSAVDLAALPPQQLMLEFLNGERKYALLPEPLVSLLRKKMPQVDVVASLEDEYTARFPGEFKTPGRMPQAGVAINAALLTRDPALADSLVDAMRRAADKERQSPDLGLLPPATLRELGEDVIRASLKRDVIMVQSAAEARQDILRFLRLTNPEILDAGGNPPAGFLRE